MEGFQDTRLTSFVDLRSADMSTDKTGFEIPDQMRDFAEKSVDQARKAFDDFMGATHKAVSNAEDSANAVQAGAADVNKKALNYAEEHVDAAFKFAQELVKAQNVEDMMKLQQDYLRRQMESLGEQAREFSNSATKAVQDAAKATQKK
ncbi:phasin [Roseibium aggregatum]|jgi:phasin|nr:phasin [Labrenzia sp. C1B10]ERP99278.1 phasin [Labrenzia sp. C1B70]MBN8179465.1 phasin [Roseibium aggregatum]MBO6858098.1 phasin [Roseibium sp.]UES46320.1 phasin [Roseibium aggregatum]